VKVKIHRSINLLGGKPTDKIKGVSFRKQLIIQNLKVLQIQEQRKQANPTPLP
jgi:hypothetical protein